MHRPAGPTWLLCLLRHSVLLRAMLCAPQAPHRSRRCAYDLCERTSALARSVCCLPVPACVPPACRYQGSADAVRKNLGELKDEARGITPATDYIILSGAGKPGQAQQVGGQAPGRWEGRGIPACPALILPSFLPSPAWPWPSWLPSFHNPALDGVTSSNQVAVRHLPLCVCSRVQHGHGQAGGLPSHSHPCWAITLHLLFSFLPAPPALQPSTAWTWPGWWPSTAPRTPTSPWPCTRWGMRMRAARALRRSTPPPVSGGQGNWEGSAAGRGQGRGWYWYWSAKACGGIAQVHPSSCEGVAGQLGGQGSSCSWQQHTCWCWGFGGAPSARGGAAGALRSPPLRTCCVGPTLTHPARRGGEVSGEARAQGPALAASPPLHSLTGLLRAAPAPASSPLQAR